MLPRSKEELQAAVRDAKGLVRVVGRGHSFSPLSEVKGGTLISLMQFAQVLDYRAPGPGQHGHLTFQGGATFTDLAHFLQEQSPPTALGQTPSPLFITMAGAIATGTHGSGIRNEPLSSFVESVEIVTADGSLVRYDKKSSPDELHGAVVSAGCLGVISEMTVQVVPWFDVQIFRHNVPLESLINNWRGIFEEDSHGGLRCDSVSSWVHWHEGQAMVTTRHFLPHYDASLAAGSPQWGSHPWHSTTHIWKLVADRCDDLAATLRSVGVTLDADGAVAALEPGSMAADAGVEVGWFLAEFGEGPAPLGAEGLGLPPSTPAPMHGGVIVGRRAEARSAAESAFLRLPAVDLKGPFQQGSNPKILCLFENPACPNGETHEAWRGPWHDNMPVWPLGTACSPGPECEYGNQAEYFVPSDCAVDALRAAWAVLRQWSFCDQEAAPVLEVGKAGAAAWDLKDTGMLGIGELRCVRGDSAWLSPCRDRDTVSFHISFSGHPDRLEEIERELPKLEEALLPFGCRFHWGKLHTSSLYAPRLEELYGDGLRKFRALARRLDPSGKFRNRWAQELFGSFD